MSSRQYGFVLEVVRQDADKLREKLESGGAVVLPRDLAERILRDLDQMALVCHTLDVASVVLESQADRERVLRAIQGGKT